MKMVAKPPPYRPRTAAAMRVGYGSKCY